MPYLLFPIWTKRCMDFGHLLTHVPFAMPTFWWWQGRDVHNVRPHFIGTYTNNSIFEWPSHNIGSTIGLTHPIGHKHVVQTWNGFGMLTCLLLHGGINMMNDNMTNPWFRRHVNCCIYQWPIHNIIGFIKCFGGGITQEPTSLNMV
jgi:hypothetical protein